MKKTDEIKIKNMSAIDFCINFMGWIQDQDDVIYNGFKSYKTENKLLALQGEARAFEKIRNKIRFYIEEESK